MKFNKNGNLIPQKVKYNIKHNETDEEMIERYIKKKTDFQIDYDHKGNAIFVKKEKLKSDIINKRDGLIDEGSLLIGKQRGVAQKYESILKKGDIKKK